jgi:hypothetical protein
MSGTQPMPDPDAPSDGPRPSGASRPLSPASTARHRRRFNASGNLPTHILTIVAVASLFGLLTPSSGEAAICFTVSVAGIGVIAAIRGIPT